MRRALAVAVVLVGTSLYVSSPALGCSVVDPGPTEAELLAMADVVFEGVAGSHRDPNVGAPVQTTGDPIFWTFTVERQVKGTVAAVQEVASARSGVSCGIAFTEGSRYRVYARYIDGVLTTSFGSGTRLLPETTTSTTPSTTVPPTRAVRAPRIALTG